MIKPALTPEQWLRYAGANLEQDLEYAAEELGGYYGTLSAHALAALALYNQDYGFTWEDVDALLSYADFNARTTRAYRPELDPLRSIATRMAALLPPRE